MRHLVLTPGDPTGIGPEITIKVLRRFNEFRQLSLTVIGSISALENAAQQLGVDLPSSGNIQYITIEDELPGEIAYQAIEKAVQLLCSNEAEALVTGPISKQNLKAAGYGYPGHTEILQELSRRYYGIEETQAEMLFVYKSMRLMLLTRHTALRDVSAELLKQDKIEQAFSILIGFLNQKLKIELPKLAILGVNPHAGEVGCSDEENVLKSIIADLRKGNLADCEGPIPADAFFRGFKPASSPYNAIVAAYHDQGLIPFKMLAGYEAVNVTIGLPFLRTSVSHGTAEDIVGKCMGNESSLLAAIYTAIEMTENCIVL
jgi:4-hydroxythreonine-4-phosphate dehydrogenase